MLPFWAILSNTTRECLRQPIFVILTLCSLVIIALYPAMALFVFRGQEKLVTDGSLATILILGQICAVFSAAYSIAWEIESGTIQLVLTKPVGRITFFLAKLLGIWGALTVFFIINGIGVLISLKAATDQFRFDPYLFTSLLISGGIGSIYGGLRNYYSRKPFPSSTVQGLLVYILCFGIVAFFMPTWNSFSYEWDKGPSYFHPEVAKELILIYFAILIMGCLAAVLSTYFKLVANMTICMLLYLLGLMGEWFKESLLWIQLSTIERILSMWPFFLLPFLVFFWWLAIARYSSRKNLKVSRWEIHLSCLALSLPLLYRCIYELLVVQLPGVPSVLVRWIAKFIYFIREWIALLVYTILPNWQHLWLADAITRKKTIPWEYIGLGGCYTFCLISFLVCIGLICFVHRDLSESV